MSITERGSLAEDIITYSDVLRQAATCPGWDDTAIDNAFEWGNHLQESIEILELTPEDEEKLSEHLQSHEQHLPYAPVPSVAGIYCSQHLFLRKLTSNPFIDADNMSRIFQLYVRMAPPDEEGSLGLKKATDVRQCHFTLGGSDPMQDFHRIIRSQSVKTTLSEAYEKLTSCVIGDANVTDHPLFHPLDLGYPFQNSSITRRGYGRAMRLKFDQFIQSDASLAESKLKDYMRDKNCTEIILFAFLSKDQNDDAVTPQSRSFWRDIVVTSLSVQPWYNLHPWTLSEVANQCDAYVDRLVQTILSPVEGHRREMEVLVSHMINRSGKLKGILQGELKRRGTEDGWLMEIMRI
ncbi:hypothetical protein PROFUN_05060 [Planoprotostelium fungivorum]|uniref:Uncharacterized protein n=1 Tax=Planoprotostelium fungivorum TaxID=1890364 RepID=A0A2P6NSA3_9EUKA|nr:hypothetical protein PROFUN_05060 [Planoprotostelium fungivorum]